jgi:hypothetical protein
MIDLHQKTRVSWRMVERLIDDQKVATHLDNADRIARDQQAHVDESGVTAPIW